MKRLLARLSRFFTRGRSSGASVALPAKGPAGRPDTAPSAAVPITDPDPRPVRPQAAAEELSGESTVETEVTEVIEATRTAEVVGIAEVAEPAEDGEGADPEPSSAAAASPEPQPSMELQPDPVASPESVPPIAEEPAPVVRYSDFSDTEYAVIAGRFPPPPGYVAADASGRPVEEGETATLVSSLPSVLLDEMLADLSVGRTLAEDILEAEPVSIGWPRATDGRRFEISHPDARFCASSGDVRTLQAALPGGGLTDGLDRLELVRLVGIGLQALHAAEVVTGGVTLDVFAFAVGPRPSVRLLRPDRLRRIGAEQLVADHRTWGRRFDDDRFEFAMVAHQLLIGGQPVASPSDLDELRITGLLPSQCRDLARLWSRALDEPGSRPQVSEWMEVLLP